MILSTSLVYKKKRAVCHVTYNLQLWINIATPNVNEWPDNTNMVLDSLKLWTLVEIHIYTVRIFTDYWAMQDIWKYSGWIWTKLDGWVGYDDKLIRFVKIQIRDHFTKVFSVIWHIYCEDKSFLVNISLR